MKKLLASDYDGTFYINDMGIVENIKLVNKFMKKNIFVIATGRSYLDFMKKKIKYNIPYHYLVINHGATIIYCDHVIYNENIDDKIKDEIVQLLSRSSYEEMFLCSELESRVDVTRNEITKIHVSYGDQKRADEVCKQLKEKYGNNINCLLVTGNTGIEIVSNKVDKANAVEFIMNKERIKESKVYTTGNGETDVKMINKFNGYMIINSHRENNNTSGKSINNVGELLKELV